MSEDVEFEVELEAPPEKVWRALETPELREAWLAPAEVPAAQGGPIDCEVLERTPGERLRIGWRGAGLNSHVTFTVTPSGAGSRLRIVHGGLAAEPVAANSNACMRMAA